MIIPTLHLQVSSFHCLTTNKDLDTVLLLCNRYLYDILTKASVVKKKIPVLICCNKSDKVTAHTKEFIRKQMEKEVYDHEFFCLYMFYVCFIIFCNIPDYHKPFSNSYTNFVLDITVNR